MYVVHTQGLGKHYSGARTWALQDVNLSLAPGSVYGLIGENGAGKTTLIRLLLGFIRPSSGHVHLAAGLGVGYVPERPSFWTTLTVREQIVAVSRCSGLRGAKLCQRVSEVLNMVDLAGKADSKIRSLSRGMLQRLGVAQAVVPNPELIIMDEPASGLDPAGQKGMRELIRELHAMGKTILLSSHYLVEMERVCTRIAVLHKGHLVLEESFDDMLLRYRDHVEMELDRNAVSIEEDLIELGLSIQIDDNRVVFDRLGDGDYASVMSLFADRGIRILRLGYPGLLLEKIFTEASGGETQ